MRSSDHGSPNQAVPNTEARFLRDLFASEAIGGAIALVAALVAVLWANVDLHGYQHLQHLRLGPLSMEHWAADGGLTLFFFIAGLELKREFVQGSLRDPRAAAIPVAAACCGVAVPALLFILLNLGTANLRGWAIPAPTDIAFALAVLAILGRRAPSALRVFLLTLAVVDDVIVIAIIAFAYSNSLQLGWLLGAVALIGLYAALFRVGRPPAWLLVPIAIGAWWCTLHSGIHATVAGVVLALLTPVSERLEHALAPWSAGLVVPVFALTSAGVAIGGHGTFDNRVFWGVLVGLVIGKPLGIALGTLATATVMGRRWTDSGAGLRDLVGLGLIAGIGFTVAILVSDLAYSDERLAEAKTAVLAASAVAAVLGVLVLGLRHETDPATADPTDAAG